MAQAVGRWPPTSETPVWSQVSPCEVCVEQSDTVTGSPPHTSVSPVSVIPTVLHTQLDLQFARSKPAMHRNLITAVLWWNLEALDRKVVFKEMCAECCGTSVCLLLFQHLRRLAVLKSATRTSTAFPVFCLVDPTVQFTQILKVGFSRSS